MEKYGRLIANQIARVCLRIEGAGSRLQLRCRVYVTKGISRHKKHQTLSHEYIFGYYFQGWVAESR